MPPKGLRVNEAALAGLSDADREKVLSELRAVELAFEKNPLWGYRPHGKQLVFHSPEPDASWPRIRAFFGGNRSGKTTATMVDTLVQALDVDQVPDHLRSFKRWESPFYCRVVTPDLTNTLEGVVLQKFREWCPREQLKGNSFDRAYDKVQRILKFKNGSWIQFFSNDQDLDKFGGAALHRVVYDEEPRQDIRRECLMRLIDYGGEEMYGMTPLHGMSWVFDEIYEPWERGQFDGRVVVVDMDDNPHLDRDTMKWILSGLSSEEREARKSGRFVSFSGLIYPQFSTERHVIPAIERVPPGVEAFRMIDPGYRHLCAVLYGYLDADDEMVIFDEIGLQQATIKQVCDEMHRRDLAWGDDVNGARVPLVARWTVIDPASRNKNSQTGRSDQAEFSEHGVHTIPGQNEVGAGINRVKERLDADRLKITANCVGLLGEFKRYRWTKDSGRSENEARERPVKKDDHRIDALRYGIAQRPLRPAHERPKESLTKKDWLLREALKQFSRFGNQPVHPSGAGMFE